MKTRSKTILFAVACCLVAQPATSLFAQEDPNESSVADNRDFRDSRVSYSNGRITADIVFYDSLSSGMFVFYFSSDNDNVADYMVRCYNSYFVAHKNTSGSPGPPEYRGTPTVNGKKYSLRFPPKAIGLTSGGTHTIRYWFYWPGYPGDADRMPNSGHFELRFKY